jgi:hypothetical protein
MIETALEYRGAGLLGFSQDELAKLLDTGVQEGLCGIRRLPARTCWICSAAAAAR